MTVPEVVLGLVALAVLKPHVKYRLGVMAALTVATWLTWNVATAYR